jgi:hypothetical protein
MNYTLKNSDWQWLIEQDPKDRRYTLKCRRPTAWTECNRYDSPEAAADAVDHGTTGQKEWDDLKHEGPFPGLASWLIDPTGGPLASVIPIVSDLLRAAILPPPPQSG